MKTLYLADCPECIPTLAKWFHEEWGCFSPGRSLADMHVAVRRRCNYARLPLAFVFMEGGEILGTVSLKQYDMSSRMHLSPWLSSVYVAAEHRGKGLGTALVRLAMEKAARLRFGDLYLFTPDAQRFYIRLGWAVLENCLFHGRRVSVMHARVTPAPPEKGAASS
ncbi:MAG: GNAT family N-acetyltransferase [Kiritimatiellae bacterium]|nr:GNAT family N-acetyltransferase [Kiritimatiellia bacterium]